MYGSNHGMHAVTIKIVHIITPAMIFERYIHIYYGMVCSCRLSVYQDSRGNDLLFIIKNSQKYSKMASS